MLVAALDEGSGMDALTAILLPALGTYEGRLVVVTEPAISCTVATHTVSPKQTFTLLYQTTTRNMGPMTNVMATLLNIGGALCSTPQSLADAHY